MTGNSVLPQALARDYRTAKLSHADRAMLDYAVRLTESPLHADDGIEALRSAGFDDRAILDICQVTAYYNYVNRLADGLGVELESYWKDEDMTMTRDDFERGLAERQPADPGRG